MKVSFPCKLISSTSVSVLPSTPLRVPLAKESYLGGKAMRSPLVLTEVNRAPARL